jgi:hypothetical protein
VLPVAVVAVAGAGLIVLHYGRRSAAGVCVLCFATAWASAAVAARLVFPLSLAGIWWLFLVVASAGGALFWTLIRGERAMLPAWLAGGTAGALIGILVVWWQIPESPSTVPWNADLPLAVSRWNGIQPPRIVTVADNVVFDASAARLAIAHGNLRFQCSPLITFDRISPDRFWSLLARGIWTPVRRYVKQTITEEARDFHYDDGSTVHFPRQGSDGSLELTACTVVRTSTYSHLNTFCYLEIDGHESLALSFSPCADTIVDVQPADYPFGRPARFAYLDAGGRYRVCQATSGEKGPFHELASGPLHRGEPLVIDIHDNRRRIASIRLEDWPTQASTALSPSAGWGVPVNAIEFQRLGESTTDSAGIWITLAATAIGRGFETVGHRPGTYRNQIAIRWEPLAEANAAD